MTSNGHKADHESNSEVEGFSGYSSDAPSQNKKLSLSRPTTSATEIPDEGNNTTNAVVAPQLEQAKSVGEDFEKRNEFIRFGKRKPFYKGLVFI